jgi:hypothetical protein
VNQPVNTAHSSAADSACMTKETGASYRVLVSVLEGMHSGAAFIGTLGQSVVIGAETGCDLLLLDDGVAAKALCLFERNGQLAAQVLGQGVRLRGNDLPVGLTNFTTPQIQLKVGSSLLQVELLRRSVRRAAHASSTRSEVRKPAVVRVGNWAAIGLACASLAGGLAALGGGVNASPQFAQSAPLTRTLSAVVDGFNARGAELGMARDPEGQPMLRGFVLDATMREALEVDIAAAGLKAKLQVHEVRQMTESLNRLTRLTNHDCEAKYQGEGRFSCEAGLADEATVERLQALGPQVPGLVAWDVQALPPPAAGAMGALAAAGMAAPSASAPVASTEAQKPDAPRWPAIRHVAIGGTESLAYDAQGRRLRIGDSVDGAKLTAIRHDAVEFQRDGKRIEVAVRSMAAPPRVEVAGPAPSQGLAR